MSINHFFEELAKMQTETPISTKITIYTIVLIVVIFAYFFLLMLEYGRYN